MSELNWVMSHGSKFLLGLELELGESWLIDTFTLS